MYVRKNNLGFIVNDGDAYTDSKGIKYPRNYPKDEIAELVKVTETEQPTADVITGWYVDESFTQVWQGRAFTQEELEQQARQSWEQEFYSLDAVLPRYAEDIIKALDNKNKLSKEAKERAERKKELRAEGKNKGYI